MTPFYMVLWVGTYERRCERSTKRETTDEVEVRVLSFHARTSVRTLCAVTGNSEMENDDDGV